ncbi:MAG TPA: fructose-bisphosphate aldolase [candidate division Zixibacteria bacterium]|nr:fructose-bisphosphate aldolase [candidate division Zixibacteria bacterium]
MRGYDRMLEMMPENVRAVVGNSSRIPAVNSRHVCDALIDERVIVMACNCRIPYVIPGIMRAAEELDAVVCYELAKTEGGLDGGYTGQTPKQYAETTFQYAEETGLTKPFYVHADHLTVKDTSDEQFDITAKVIQAQIEAGYTGFAIDASHNPLQENTDITRRLAVPITELGFGLEVEVGEIAGLLGKLTTVEEAVTFISDLTDAGHSPNLLAISNGSKHGNYSEGEEVHIDLERTADIYTAIRPYGAAVAQHGITGTPLSLIGKFADYGIRKGNVGTNWQNIAHVNLPTDLFEAMKTWAETEGVDIKKATRQFKAEIDAIDDKYKKKIADEAYISAKEFITAFRADGSATKVLQFFATL